MNNQLIGALDIGSYKTKFLISSLDDKNFIKIHSKKTVHTQGIKKSNITDVDKLIDIINSCVGQAEDEIKSEIEKIYVSLAQLDLIAIFVSLGISVHMKFNMITMFKI